MFVLVLGIACVAPPASDNATLTKTADGAWLYTYDDVGVACILTADTDSQVLVDFGDCLCCSSDIDFSCDVTLSGDVFAVQAHGTLVVDQGCDTCGTCESTTVRCDAPVAAGDYTLTYAGISVPLTLPSPEWTCTGPTAVL